MKYSERNTGTEVLKAIVITLFRTAVSSWGTGILREHIKQPMWQKHLFWAFISGQQCTLCTRLVLMQRNWMTQQWKSCSSYQAWFMMGIFDLRKPQNYVRANGCKKTWAQSYSRHVPKVGIGMASLSAWNSSTVVVFSQKYQRKDGHVGTRVERNVIRFLFLRSKFYYVYLRVQISNNAETWNVYAVEVEKFFNCVTMVICWFIMSSL